MSGILTVRDNIRDIIRKYGEIIIPVLRFILAIIVFKSINSMFGYSELFNKEIVVFLLAVICALVSNTAAVLIAGAVILVSTMKVSLEIGAMYLVLFVLMYTLYMRMFRESCYVLAIVPVLMLWNATYVIPFIVVLTAGIIGIVPACFGIILYYFAQYVKEAKAVLDAVTQKDKFQEYSYIAEGLLNNKEMLSIIVVSGIVMVITYVIYRLPFDYSWYISIGVGAICNILFNAVVGASLGADTSIVTVIFQSIIGVLAALLIQFCKGILNYSKKEIVQFEDDEYYYYVKAIPKYGTHERTHRASSKPGNQTKGSGQSGNTGQTMRRASGTANNAQTKTETKRDYVSSAVRDNNNVSRNNNRNMR